MVATDIDRSTFEVAPPRRKIGVCIFFEIKVSRKPLMDALNDAARAKAQLVEAGGLSSVRFARELDQVVRKYDVVLAPDAYLVLAQRFDLEGKYERATKCYRQALESTPDNATILVNLGAVLGKGGKHRESVDVLLKAVELRPANVMALNNLAASLRRLGRLDEAMAHLERAIKLDPAYSTAYLNKAKTLSEKGKRQEAIEVLRHATKIRDPKPFLFAYLGMCLFEAGSFSESVDAFEQAIHRGSVDPGVLFALALAFVALGRKEQALGPMAEFEAHLGAKELLADAEVGKQYRAAKDALRRDTDASSEQDLAKVVHWESAVAKVRARGNDRFRAELSRMQRLGLVDERGQATSKGLPADMRPGSKSDIAT